MCRTESDEVDLEDPARRWTIVVGPARMDAGIATDQLAVEHRQAVRVAGVRNEVHRLQHLAGRGFVPHETGPVLAVARTVVAGNLPDGAVVPCDAVVTHPIRSLVERDQKFRLPSLGVNAKIPAQPQRRDPQLPVVPEGTVATAAVVGRTERDLTVADQPGVHVHLKNASRDAFAIIQTY